MATIPELNKDELILELNNELAAKDLELRQMRKLAQQLFDAWSQAEADWESTTTDEDTSPDE